jgi:hypothetical protein
MTLRLEPICVATRSADEDGCLVYADERLVAVLVRLSTLHESASGRWFLEAGFGITDWQEQPMFADLDEAQVWITRRL